MAEPKWTFGTDSSATVVPIGALRWYRFEWYDGTDSNATLVPIQVLLSFRFADIVKKNKFVCIVFAKLFVFLDYFLYLCISKNEI